MKAYNELSKLMCEMERQEDNISLVMTIVSCMSIFGSFCVIFVYIFSVQRKSSSKIIFYIAISDLLGGIGTSFGLSYPSSWQCIAQGLLGNIFPLSSCFWTAVIVFEVIRYLKRAQKDEDCVHEDLFLDGWGKWGICWGIPIIVTVVPLSTGKFGCVNVDRCYCYYESYSDSPIWVFQFWYYASFYVWVWTGIVIYLLMYVYVYFTLATSMPAFTTHVRKRLIRLAAYPFVTLLCWGYTSILDVQYEFPPFYGKYMLANALPCAQGVLTSIVFFLTHANVLLNRFRKPSSRLVFVTAEMVNVQSPPPAPAPPPPPLPSSLGNTMNKVIENEFPNSVEDAEEICMQGSKSAKSGNYFPHSDLHTDTCINVRPKLVFRDDQLL